MVIYFFSVVVLGMESVYVLIEMIKCYFRGKFVMLLINWCGEFLFQEVRWLFSEVGLLIYCMLEGMIIVFMYMVEYWCNQK